MKKEDRRKREKGKKGKREKGKKGKREKGKKGKREKGKKGKRERKGRRAPRTCLRHAVSALRFGEGSNAPTGVRFLFYFADAGFEGLKREAVLIFVDHERRREAD